VNKAPRGGVLSGLARHARAGGAAATRGQAGRDRGDLGRPGRHRRTRTDRLRTQLVYGIERADNLAIQGPDDLERTTYVLVNLAYRAFQRMDIGAEYTWGERRNRDGQKGHANRLLLGVNFGF
jgi:hypothetical protein